MGLIGLMQSNAVFTTSPSVKALTLLKLIHSNLYVALHLKVPVMLYLYRITLCRECVLVS